MRQVMLIAEKELRDGMRNRWVLAVTALLAAFALTLAFLGAAPTGTVKADALAVTVVSLSSLSIFLLPLIALLLSFDAIVGELERGTLGAAAGLSGGALAGGAGQVRRPCRASWRSRPASATAPAGAAVALASDSRRLGGVRAAVASSVLLGAAFIAIGYVVSALVRDRGHRGGARDRRVAGLRADLRHGAARRAGCRSGAQHWRRFGRTWLLLFNPADAYRMLNLAGTPGARLFSGMAGLAGDVRLSAAALAGALALWVAVPLAAAIGLFARRQI